MKKVDYNIEYAHVYAGSFTKDEIIGEEQRTGIIVAKQVVENLEAAGKTYSLNILIDDYNEEAIEVNEELVVSELTKKGLSPDYVMRESRLAGPVAEVLIDNISDRYLDKRTLENEIIFAPKTNDIRLWAPDAEKRSFRQMFLEYAEGKIDEEELKGSQLRKGGATLISKNTFRSKSEIVLKYKDKEGVVCYTCPLLTACWHLMRLGVEQFDKEFVNIKSFTSKPFFGNRLITVLPSNYLKIEGTSMEIISLAKSRSIKKYRNYLEYYFF